VKPPEAGDIPGHVGLDLFFVMTEIFESGTRLVPFQESYWPYPYFVFCIFEI
jgi:hypothetical protein